jgi:hypothetical protein
MLLGDFPTPSIVGYSLYSAYCSLKLAPIWLGFGWKLRPVRSSKRNRLLSLERPTLHWNSLSIFQQLHMVKQIGWRTKPHYLVPL